MKQFAELGLTLIAVVPYVLTAVIFVISRLSGRSSVKSFRLAADCTVPFLVIAAGLILNGMAANTGTLLAAGILIAGIIYAVTERLRSKEFRVQLMIRNLWRMLFIVFSLLYMLLLLAGAAGAAVGFTT